MADRYTAANELAEKWREKIHDPYVIADMGPEVLRNKMAVGMLGGRKEVSETVKGAQSFVHIQMKQALAELDKRSGATRTDRFLVAVRDYLPKRMQERIDDRAASQRIERALMVQAAKADVDASYKLSPEAQKRYDDQENYVDAKAAQERGDAANLVKQYRSDIDEPYIIAEIGPEILKNPIAVEILGGKESVTKTVEAATDFVNSERAEMKARQDNMNGGLDNPASGMTVAHKSEWVTQDGVYEDRTLVGKASDGKFYLQNESTHTSGEGPIERSPIEGPFASVREALGHNIDAELVHYKIAHTEQAERTYMAEVDAMRASGRLSKGDPAIDAAEARADVMGDASIRGRMEFEDPAKSLEGVRQTARDAAGLPSEEQRAAASWRKDAGKSYMAELTNKSRENVDYQQSQAWQAKQEANREAWAVASPVKHEQRQETQTNTLTMKP